MSTDPRQLLESRARALAQKPEAARSALDALTVFRLLGQLCAVRSSEVDAAGLLRELSPVPGAPPWLLGAKLHLGAVLSLIDLVALWGLPAPGVRDLPGFVVLTHGGRKLGVLVDQLLGSLELDGQLQPYEGPPRAGVTELTHRSGEPVCVISTPALLADARLRD